MRIVNGVTLVVAKRPDREGLEVTGTEAFVTGDRTEVTFTGDVHLTVTDGLVVHTDTLIYSRAQGLARMHDDAGLTTLTRVGMEAEGRDVVFVNDRAIVTLDGAATVRLTGDDDREAVVIRSEHATLADADRYMRFEGAAEVLTGPMVLESESATAYFGEEETALERLLLQGGARLHANEPAAGGLREMGASEMTLVFEATTRVLERATLAGASIIELAGLDGGQGAVISAAAEKPFLKVMEEQVFGPNEMGSTIVAPAQSRGSGDIATFYKRRGGKVRPWRDVDLSHRLPGGGFASTPTDLVKMGIAMLDETYISAPTREAFWTQQTLANGSVNEQGYAIGWRTREWEIDGIGLVRNANHGGVSRGAQSWLLVFPDHEMAFAFIINSKTDEFREFGWATYQDLARLFIQAQSLIARQ